MNEALLTAESAFGFLRAEPGFRIVGGTGSGGFGDACEVWKVPGLLVRFVCDRGQVSVEVGPDFHPDRWDDLGLIRTLLEGGDVMQGASLDELARYLEENRGRIAELFAAEKWNGTVERLNELRQRRARRMFPDAFGDRAN